MTGEDDIARFSSRRYTYNSVENHSLKIDLVYCFPSVDHHTLYTPIQLYSTPLHRFGKIFSSVDHHTPVHTYAAVQYTPTQIWFIFFLCRPSHPCTPLCSCTVHPYTDLVYFFPSVDHHTPVHPYTNVQYTPTQIWFIFFPL